MQDLTGKNTGDELTAAEWNQLPTEVQNAIEDAGLTLSSGDLNQLAKAISSYVSGADFYEDTGFSNNHDLDPVGNFQPPQDYYDGMRVRFKSNSTTAGGSVINVNSMGDKDLTLRDGTALVAGIISSGDVIEATFNATDDRFEITNGISASISAPGPVELATQLETDALSDTDKVVTPGTLGDPLNKTLSDRFRFDSATNLTVAATTTDTSISVPLPSSAAGVYRVKVMMGYSWAAAPAATDVANARIVVAGAVNSRFVNLFTSSSVGGHQYTVNSAASQSGVVELADNASGTSNQVALLECLVEVIDGSATDIQLSINPTGSPGSTDLDVDVASLEVALISNPPVIP